MLFVHLVVATFVVSNGFVFPDNRLTCRRQLSETIGKTANPSATRSSSSNTFLQVINDLGRPPTFLDDDIDSDGDDDDDAEEDDTQESRPKEQKQRLTKRWESLHPKLKQRLIEKGQARAIANKKKREPIRDKKRR